MGWNLPWSIFMHLDFQIFTSIVKLRRTLQKHNYWKTISSCRCKYITALFQKGLWLLTNLVRSSCLRHTFPWVCFTAPFPYRVSWWNPCWCLTIKMPCSVPLSKGGVTSEGIFFSWMFEIWQHIFFMFDFGIHSLTLLTY